MDIYVEPFRDSHTSAVKKWKAGGAIHESFVAVGDTPELAMENLRCRMRAFFKNPPEWVSRFLGEKPQGG